MLTELREEGRAEGAKGGCMQGGVNEARHAPSKNKLTECVAVNSRIVV